MMFRPLALGTFVFQERSGANGSSVDLTSNLGSTANGFTKISQSGSDVLLEIAELYVDTGVNQKQEAAITIVDGNTDTVKFLGKNTTNGTITGMAGQTDSEYYFKATVNSSERLLIALVYLAQISGQITLLTSSTTQIQAPPFP